MNRKLKKYAERQSMHFYNERFLLELKTRQREKTNQHHFYNKKFVSLFVSLSAVLVTATVVLLCVFLIKPTTIVADIENQSPMHSEPIQEDPIPEAKPPKEYLGDNFRVEECNMEEVNNIMYYFTFFIDGAVGKQIDKSSEDTLFYTINYDSEDELSTFKFKVYVNPDYRTAELYSEYDKEEIVAAHKIQYSETVNCEDSIYIFTEIGKIITDREIILINAEIIGFEENSNFIEVLNEIIQAK